MHTQFSVTQLADPKLAEADSIIRACVRHGFCPQTCPTYVLLGDENDSPRGRIDLIRAMLEQGGAPPAATVRHIDRCLSCLSCETTCAARVEFRHLADRARVHIEMHYRRPWRERGLRWLLASLLPHPGRLRLALAAARLGRPFARWLPGRLRGLVESVPPAYAGTACNTAESLAALPPQREVALLAGCVQQVLGAHINAATVRVLERHGCRVHVAADAVCCGALTLHMGREADALAAARSAIETWEALLAEHALTAIVVNTSGCGTLLKDYGRLFAHDPHWYPRAARIAGLVKDVSEVLADLPLTPRTDVPELPIAYHDACSLQHGQGLVAPPRALLRRLGFALREVPERHFCCGSAGTYNLLQPAIATRLGERKARHVAATSAVLFAAGNLGCLLQIGRYSALPGVHTVELADWATGGPLPPALAGLDLTAYPPRTAADSPGAAVPAADEINFWLYAPPTTASEHDPHGH